MFPLKETSWVPVEEAMKRARLFFADGAVSRARELAQIVDTVRIVDELTPILPLALCAYCQLPLNEVIMEAPETWKFLFDADMKLCVQAVLKLQAYKFKIFSAFSDPVARDNCEDFEDYEDSENHKDTMGCKSALLKVIYRGLTSDPEHSNLLDLGFSWHTSYKDWEDVCKRCQKGIENEMEECREELWEDLGRIFGMESWPPKPDLELDKESDCELE
jgi:hypothetical protein